MILLLTLLIFFFWLISGADLLCGLLFKIPVLSLQNFQTPEKFPKVSILFSARNEERRIPEALASMLALDYPNYEVIALNDRSTDKTLFEMEKFKGNPRLKILTIAELPQGWLGKNHALQKGYEVSSGDWLLFTDADVSFHPKTLQAVVGFSEKREIDHLPLLPKMISKGFWGHVYAQCFMFGFFLHFRPGDASNPKSKNYLGMGAFNWVRRSVYEKIGGHAAFRLNVLDDMELGRKIKQAGFKELPAAGKDFVRVPWIEEGWQGILKSIEKNGFAGVHYSIRFLFFSTLFAILVNIFPYILVFFLAGIPRLLLILSLAIIFCCYGAFQKHNPGTLWVFFFHPLGVLLVFYMIWRSALLALRQGGIRWRETFYKLADLKEHR